MPSETACRHGFCFFFWAVGEEYGLDLRSDVRFHHHEDIIFRLDDRSAAREYEEAVSSDEVNEYGFRQVEILDRLSGSGGIFRNVKLIDAARGESGLLEFQRCAGSCARSFVEFQPLGELHEGSALDEYGAYDDEKDEVEDLDGVCEEFRIFVEIQAWEDREHDRRGASDPSPGNEEFFAEIEGTSDQRDENARRACGEHEEDGDAGAAERDTGKLARRDEQSQRKEERDLHQPRDPVVKASETVFEEESGISHRQSADIDGHESVSGKKFTGTVGETDRCDPDDVVETVVIEFCVVHQARDIPSDEETDERTDADTQRHEVKDGKDGCRWIQDQVDHEEGQERRHGVVASGFVFQDGAEIAF